MINIRDKKLLKNFGTRLRELRLKKDLSQEILAYEADIPISQIGRIERGEVNATLSTLKKIANALGISLSELVKF
ncbi:MAG: helix-turn-helix transcriptional regulator [Chryseotalea sp. WA131a]|nr:MAG: helix-turn-helix transcriptional regulator [Chryseotalea sp. WA131a]